MDLPFHNHEIDQLLRELDEADLRAFALAAEDNSQRNFAQISMLSSAHFFMFLKTDAAEDLNQAIAKADEALTITATEHADRADQLIKLSFMLDKKYDRINAIDDLDLAISYAEAASAATPDAHIQRAQYSKYYVTLLMKKYEKTNRAGDLEQAVQVAEEAAFALPTNHPDRASSLLLLSTRLLDLDRSLEDARKAVLLLEEAMVATPSSDLGIMREIDDAILKVKTILKRGPRDIHPNELEPNVDEDEKSEETSTHEDKALSAGDDDLVGSLLDRGVMLSEEFERTGEVTSLEEAIQLSKLTLDLTPYNSWRRALYFVNFSRYLVSYFTRTSDLSDLEKGIQEAGQEYESLPEDHPDRTGWLGILGDLLGKRYERTGEIQDLEKAISIAREILESAQHPRIKLPAMISLGNMLENRYDLSYEMNDLEEAIKITREYINIEFLPRHLAGGLNNLGNMLEARYQRTKKTEDLEEAIEVTRDAIKNTPPNDPDMASRLNNLANKLHERYAYKDQNIDDLEEAIKQAREAVKLSVHTHDIEERSINLANKLRSRFERTGEKADLEESIQLTRQAIATYPDKNDPRMARALTNFGWSLRYKFEENSDEGIGIVEEMSACFNDAWKCVTASPVDRVRAASMCIGLFGLLGELDSAIQLGKDVIDLLPTIQTNLLDRDDQQFVVSTFAGVAAELCTFLLESGQPEEALQYLEQGRAVIIGQLIDRRSGASGLTQGYPKIAERYESLLREVNTPIRKDDVVEVQVLERRREAISELDACIKEIRGIEGYERFLLRLTTAEMQECAMDGSIVIVNVTKFGSDAIIVSRTAIKTVPLPNMSASMAKEEAWMSRELTRQFGTQSELKIDEYRDWSLLRCAERNAKVVGKTKDNDGFRKFLARLWSECVRVVLEELGYYKTSSSDQELPRIWWIGTGAASSLPFHAAGDHSIGSDENTLSWVISSYTPTIKALLHTRRKTAAAVDKHTFLLVAMSKTPGGDDLPGVEEEERVIRKTVQEPHSIQSLIQPDKSDVLGTLSDISIVHFACHASSDLMDPSSSFLALQGASDTVPEKLTVKEILDANLEQPWLAYLSACSTAQNKVQALADEGLHLASSFQVAGFGHVVASMWPSNDRICVEVARIFYRDLVKNGGLEDRDRDRAVAKALHAAVLEIRLRNWERPYLWAQYIHSGA